MFEVTVKQLYKIQYLQIYAYFKLFPKSRKIKREKMYLPGRLLDQAWLQVVVCPVW